MKFALVKFVFTFLALGMAILPARAATVSASFSVSVTVVSGCQVTAPARVGASSATRVAASSVSITCTNPTAYDVSLVAEPAIGTTTGSATGPARYAAGATSNLQENGASLGLAKAVNWTPAVGRGAIDGTGRGFFEPHTAYGETASAQSSASGQRASLIVVTVTY